MWLNLASLCLISSIFTPIASSSSYPSPPGRGTGAWEDAYTNARILVSQMTLTEKVNITRGYPNQHHHTTCAGMTGSVPRLDWSGMCLHDAGNGLRGTDMVSSFPSGIHVGASWDRRLAYLRAWFMAREFRAKGVNVLLGPNAGPLGRSPLGGRNWEGFSVDPWLSGRLNGDFVRGCQDAGVIATIKHLIGNEQETYRRPYFGVEAVSSNIDDKTLHEIYLWPFVDAIHENVASVMCSYQRLNGSYSCDNSELLNGVLKTELGFQGFVMLDWNAIHSVQSANAGLDMVMPGDWNYGENLTSAVEEERVTDMATRIIAAWYLVGQQDFPPPGIGMKNLTEPHDPIDARDPASKPMMMNGAIAGHVLVKNENNTLPLKKPKVISVFGYDAVLPATKNIDKVFDLGYMSYPEMADAELGTWHSFNQAALGGTIITGGRAGANAPAYIIDPLSAIQRRAAEDNTWVNWDTSSSNPLVSATSSVCLVFINAMATEGWDRTGLHDDPSDALVLNVASKCANTIVIVHAAGIRLVDQWINHPNVTATIMAHLPGQDSGEALVRLLYGDANFSGKLPYTLAKNESDYSVLEVCGRKSLEDRDPQCDFEEGVYLDYRAFDARGVEPRYEFGFGLSYTWFGYSALEIDQRSFSTRTACGWDEQWEIAGIVTARVKNMGMRRGEEVAQLYLQIPAAADDDIHDDINVDKGSTSGGPVWQLRGFEKIKLEAGEEGEVRFELQRRDFASWDVIGQRWALRGGEYGVFVGASSRDVRLKGRFVVDEV